METTQKQLSCEKAKSLSSCETAKQHHATGSAHPLHGAAKLIVDGIPITKLHADYTSYGSARTEVLLKFSSEIILWHLNMLLKESVDPEITRK